MSRCRHTDARPSRYHATGTYLWCPTCHKYITTTKEIAR